MSYSILSRDLERRYLNYLCAKISPDDKKKAMKNQKQILDKLKIAQLNKMQKEMIHFYHIKDSLLLLSPTGSGKTLAFLLPLMSSLDRNIVGVQCLILAPSRELASQIYHVAVEMGAGVKINLVYGGRPISLDKKGLKYQPSVVIGTPGRVLDHLERSTISTEHLKTLILDEYDKSLEVGFEESIEEIHSHLDAVEKHVFTSATSAITLPEFLELDEVKVLDFQEESRPVIDVLISRSEEKDKLNKLLECLTVLKEKRLIVFCNFRESAQRILDFLEENDVKAVAFYGGLDQGERERALVKFRNNSVDILVSTDLAARGIDISDLDGIIQFHLPHKQEDYIHRNGRTARMQAEGFSLLIIGPNESIPEYIKEYRDFELINEEKAPEEKLDMVTLELNVGRRNKISKGDIAGLFYKKGKLKPEDLGLIELKENCTYVGLNAKKVKQVLSLIEGEKIKKTKPRIFIVD